MQDLLSFRFVVRGTDGTGRRVRRVRTVQSPSYEQAWYDFADHAEDMAYGLLDVGYSVLPPCGIKVDGTASAGWELA